MKWQMYMNSVGFRYIRTWSRKTPVIFIIPACLSIRTSVCMSVHMYWHGSYWTDFHEFDTEDFYNNLSRKSIFG